MHHLLHFSEGRLHALAPEAVPAIKVTLIDSGWLLVARAPGVKVGDRTARVGEPVALADDDRLTIDGRPWLFRAGPLVPLRPFDLASDAEAGVCCDELEARGDPLTARVRGGSSEVHRTSLLEPLEAFASTPDDDEPASPLRIDVVEQRGLVIELRVRDARPEDLPHVVLLLAQRRAQLLRQLVVVPALQRRGGPFTLDWAAALSTVRPPTLRALHFAPKVERAWLELRGERHLIDEQTCVWARDGEVVVTAPPLSPPSRTFRFQCRAGRVRMVARDHGTLRPWQPLVATVHGVRVTGVPLIDGDDIQFSSGELARFISEPALEPAS